MCTLVGLVRRVKTSPKKLYSWYSRPHAVRRFNKTKKLNFLNTKFSVQRTALPKPRDSLTPHCPVRGSVTADSTMLSGVWQELDYGIDVCRVTNVLHIEHM
ncbi:hypothetical protein TNCV_4155311 [Trichonephila clavipes]|nr:hypothetical protein TNCV_4155311 [Trichonephila clavipes]